MSEAEVSIPGRGPRQEVAGRNRFFLGASVLLLLIALVGFAPTFYLRGVFPVPPRPIGPGVILHGGVMTAWYLLFVTQAGLIAARRPDIHRRLGIAGAALAAAVLASGVYVNRHLAARIHAPELRLPPQVLNFLENVVTIGLVLLAAFAVFVMAAILLRQRTEAHRRLMFLALLTTLGPPLGPDRWLGKAFGSWLPHWPGLAVLAPLVFLAALVVHDLASQRRIHPATCWGGLLLVAVLLVVNYMLGAQ